jgi:hypothetical protein
MGGTSFSGIRVDSAYIAIFWLSDDYMTIVDEAGQKPFNASDLVKPSKGEHKVLEPEVVHKAFKKDSEKYNRGRILIVDGVIELWVGEYCPEEAINNIKAHFGLSEYKVVPRLDIGYDKVDERDKIKVRSA